MVLVEVLILVVRTLTSSVKTSGDTVAAAWPYPFAAESLFGSTQEIEMEVLRRLWTSFRGFMKWVSRIFMVVLAVVVVVGIVNAYRNGTLDPILPWLPFAGPITAVAVMWLVSRRWRGYWLCRNGWKVLLPSLIVIPLFLFWGMLTALVNGPPPKQAPREQPRPAVVTPPGTDQTKVDQPVVEQTKVPESKPQPPLPPPKTPSQLLRDETSETWGDATTARESMVKVRDRTVEAFVSAEKAGKPVVSLRPRFNAAIGKAARANSVDQLKDATEQLLGVMEGLESLQ